MSGGALNTPLMSAAAADPFYVFKDALQTEVDKANILFDRWRDQLLNTNTAKNGEFPKLHADVKKKVAALEADLQQLEGTVVMVEKAPHKFPHIADAELASRRKYVDDTKRTIGEMKATHSSRQTQGKIDSDKRALLTAMPAGSEGKTTSAFEAAHDEYIGDHRQRQEQLRKQQDESLDVLDEGVERLGAMATNINVELAEQERMIDDLDKDVDTAQESMNAAMKQITKILQTKDKCQLWTIFLLTMILVVLGILVFT